MEVDGAAARPTASEATAPAPSVNRSQLPGGATPLTGRTGGPHSFSRGTFGGRTPPSHRHPLRADLGGAARRPLVAMPPAISGDVAPMDDPDAALGDNTFIWGTTVSVAAISTAARRFFNTYCEEGSDRPKYVALVAQACANRDFCVNLDTHDLRAADPELYAKLVAYPREVMPLLDEVAREVAVAAAAAEDIDPEQPPYIMVRAFNLAQVRTIRDLDPAHIDTLVSVQGMVTRSSSIIPDLRTAHFRCEKCAAVHEVLNDSGRVSEPEKCDGCGSKWTCALVHNACSFTNKQLVKMQEKPNDIPEGETPHSVNLYVYEGNVDVCRPGDRVTITGTYRAAPIRTNPRQRSLHAVFRTYIDVMHIQRDEQGRLFTVAAAKVAAQEAAATQAAEAAQVGSQPRPAVSGGTTAPPPTSGGARPAGSTHNTGEDEFFAPEGAGTQYAALGTELHEDVLSREAEIRALAADPQLEARLIASFAPNIWEMEDVKRGLLCQLFGGLGKSFPGGRVRGEINALLVGDPSVSKSQLLAYVHALAPRGIYTSGKGSSAVGLTAYVSKDPETRELVLESGALVLSDRGICCIDEFDKMSDAARSMLHEAMEQQTVSVAKAGLISTLNARASVCACANPIGSRYNPALSVSENINLPPTLLTRFDLIYLVLDKYDEDKDRRLARHLISLYHDGATGAARPHGGAEPIPHDLLRDYIAYARARVQPQLTDAAASKLVSVYQDMRRDGRERKVVVATPRQLESLIRLSEAHARMRLKDTVGAEEVEAATRLWYTAMSGSAAGAHGGIDLENIHTGQSAAQRERTKTLAADLRKLLAQSPAGATTSVAELLAGMAPYGVTREQLVTLLRELSDIVTLDERTGIIRPRRNIVAANAGPAAVEVA